MKRIGTVLLFVLTLGASTEARQFAVTSGVVAPASPFKGDRTVVYVVTEGAGRRLYTVSKRVSYDVAAPTPVVLASGGLMLFQPLNATAEVFDAKGSRTAELALLRDAPIDYERVVLTDAQAGGVCVAIGSPADGRGTVIVLDFRGMMLQTTDITAALITGVCMTADGGRSAVGTVAWQDQKPVHSVHVLDRAGGVVSNFNAEFSKGVFLQSRGELLAWSSRSVALLAVDEEKVLWTKAEKTGRTILDAAATGDSVVMMTASAPVMRKGTWWYSAPLVRVVRMNGSAVSERRFRSAPFKRSKLNIVSGIPHLVLDGKVIR